MTQRMKQHKNSPLSGNEPNHLRKWCIKSWFHVEINAPRLHFILKWESKMDQNGAFQFETNGFRTRIC